MNDPIPDGFQQTKRLLEYVNISIITGFIAL